MIDWLWLTIIIQIIAWTTNLYWYLLFSWNINTCTLASTNTAFCSNSCIHVSSQLFSSTFVITNELWVSYIVFGTNYLMNRMHSNSKQVEPWQRFFFSWVWIMTLRSLHRLSYFNCRMQIGKRQLTNHKLIRKIKALCLFGWVFIRNFDMWKNTISTIRFVMSTKSSRMI